MFLIVPNTIPVKISVDNKKIETLIPSTGIEKPEIRINPKAEPARSALYTTEDTDEPFVVRDSSRKICPVRNAGKNDDRIKIVMDMTPVFIVRK